MPNQDIRICFVGDSLVKGTGDPACLGWAGRVCAAAIRDGHPLTHYNLGVDGDASADIAKRWREECLWRLPRGVDGRVVFSFGVNDTNLEGRQSRVSLAATEEYARQILTQARAEYPVLFIGPPPVTDYEHNRRIAVASGVLHRTANALKVPFLSVFDPLLQSSVWMEEVGVNDGFHPRGAGYAELAQLIIRWSDWWF